MKRIIITLLTIILLCMPAPVLANGLGVSPAGPLELIVPMDGELDQDFTIIGFEGTLGIDKESIPDAVFTPTEIEVTDGQTITLTFYGDGTNNTYNGKILFLALDGKDVTVGIKVRAVVTINTEVIEPTPTPAPSGGVSMFTLYDLTVENITEDSADILWETSRSTSSKLTYWSSSEVTVTDESYLKEHIVHLEELKEDTAYYFEVTCKDRYNLKKSVMGEFTTLKREVIPEPEEEEPEVVEPEEEPTPPDEEEPEVVEPEEEEPEVVEPEEEEPYVPPEEPKETPWALIGGVVGGLAAAGGIGYWLWRRRRNKDYA